MGDDDRTTADPLTPTIRQVDVAYDATLTTADRYTERGLLGVGGMGEVRELLDRSLGRIVARKRMAEDQSSARFLREVRIQAQLEHPAIVPVYNLDRRDGPPAFTMKRVQGRTLKEVLDLASRGAIDERFAPRRLLDALAQVALAVDYAHSRGVVHRDLKPANIMLGEWGEVYVLDWGVSRVLHRSRFAPAAETGASPGADQSSLAGTPGYMAPEMVRGDDPGSVSTDVWALGAILFHIVTGEPLHGGDASERILSTLSGCDIGARVGALGLDLSPELVAICERATAGVEGRYTTARMFHEALQRYLDGDRDVVLRRDMADRLAERATMSLERAVSSVDRADRRDALRSLSAALALVPDHGVALRGLIRLLTEPPREVPLEVTRRLARADAERSAALARPAAATALAAVPAIALFVWMGVRSWTMVGVAVAACALAAAAILDEGRRARRRAGKPDLAADHRRQDMLPLFAAGLACGSFTLFTTPYLGVPAAAVAMTMLRVLRDHRQPWIVALVTASSVVVPWLLQVAGVMPASLSFHDGAMTVHPLAVSFTSLPTQLLLVGGATVNIAVATAVALSFRSTLRRAELDVELQGWQLRQMLPDHATRRAPAAG